MKKITTLQRAARASVALLLSAQVYSDEKCTDASLKALDRLKLKIETGTSYSSTELKCLKLERLRNQYRSNDRSYFETSADDQAYRSDLSLRISAEQRLDHANSATPLSIGIFRTQEDKPTPQPLDTLDGYESIREER